MTIVSIDPNVRVRGNGTYAGFEDVRGPIYVGLRVDVVEEESRLAGSAIVTEIDTSSSLVYLAVDWKSLKVVDEYDETLSSSNIFANVILLLNSTRSQPRGARPLSVRLTPKPAAVVVHAVDNTGSPLLPAGNAQELVLSAS
jgi:hypothetical protein